MKLNLDDIAELAESIGNRYLSRGKVVVKNIAKKKRIEIVYGQYGNHYDGLLCQEAGRFYMHINLEKVPDRKSERIRFTISHELGHFFIDNHRKKLEQGISLSFHGEMSSEEKRIEHEANHFASHLLMPQTLFCNLARKKEQGFDSILFLKKRFDVSIYATTIHYIHLNLSSSIMIKWNADFSFHYASYSISFSALTGIKKKPPVGFPVNYVQELAKIIDENSFDYFEAATPISRWISTITPGSEKDILGLEQTLKLGDYGGITLLTFQQ